MRRGEGKEQYSDSNFAVLPSGWWTWNFRQGCKGVLLASTGLRWPVTTRSLPPPPRGGGGGGKGEEEEEGVFGPPAGIRNRHPGWWGILLSPNRTVPLRFTRLAKDPLWVSYSFGVCFVASPLFVLVLVLPTFSIIRGIKKKKEEREDRENSRTRICICIMYI